MRRLRKNIILSSNVLRDSVSDIAGITISAGSGRSVCSQLRNTEGECHELVEQVFAGLQVAGASSAQSEDAIHELGGDSTLAQTTQLIEK